MDELLIKEVPYQAYYDDLLLTQAELLSELVTRDPATKTEMTNSILTRGLYPLIDQPQSLSPETYQRLITALEFAEVYYNLQRMAEEDN